MPSSNRRPQRTANPHRTLGPVPDLERHLPEEWWKSLFDAVYLKTDGDVYENAEATAADVDRVVAALEPAREDAILDVCCGQGRHALELARRGHRHVAGIDRSRYLIRLARRRARDAKLDVQFHEGDARKIALGESRFDVAYSIGNSFGYFDREEDDLGVLTAVKRVLKSRGRFALDVSDGAWMRDHFEPRSWEWIDADHFVCRERGLSSDRDRLISREVVVHADRGVIVDQFYAERLYDAERLGALLERAGFDEIEVQPAMETASSRGEDLGLMSQRLFVTARAPAKKKRKAETGEKVTVAVILGDPRMPDEVKRGGQFNEEDFATIEKLKSALSELERYRFVYLDDHATLLDDLRKLDASLVLNLCDEGYQNDALRELHVPAVMEMLGTPYTGAGPTALGLCYNKALVRAIAAAFDVPTPLETYTDADDHSATLPSVFPALVKPAMGDSSLGITKDAVVSTPNQMVARVAELRKLLPGRPILIQEFLTGAEYTVGLVGNPGAELVALPILEVDYSGLDEGLPKILGYESKWEPDSPYWTGIAYREAELDDETRRALISWSMTLFERLECRDYARFDFRADADGQIKLLEVNPNPGWCWDGKMNLMTEMAGRRYSDFLGQVLGAAERRYAAQAASIELAER